MPKYEVTTACHVPVGPGFKHKKPGQVVTLTKAQAKKLSDFVEPLDDDDEDAPKGGQKVTPPPSKPEPKPEPSTIETETVREVTSDAGEPTPADERDRTEADQ